MKITRAAAFFIGCLISASSVAQRVTEVTYKVTFDQRFDQAGVDIRHFMGVLRATETEGYFYMTPSSLKTSTENSIEVNQDTVWRVSANLEAQELVFDDIFNESMKPRWFNDSLFPMRWDIQPVDMYIDSFLCSKATCVFRGRKYEAWFAPSVSVPFGPWKMGGLPGLILRLEDEEHYLRIDMVTVKRSSGIVSLYRGKARTYADYIAGGNKIRKLLKVSTSNSDCVDCETKVRFYSWEKVFAE